MAQPKSGMAQHDTELTPLLSAQYGNEIGRTNSRRTRPGSNRPSRSLFPQNRMNPQALRALIMSMNWPLRKRVKDSAPAASDLLKKILQMSHTTLSA